ncbi:CRISPR-associated endonuclease Cas2 [Deltaproteobacteria bacterium TL4]
MNGKPYLVVYDIADEKRLTKIAKIMEGYGIRVQKSVFETILNSQSLRSLKFKLIDVIDPIEDGVKFFQLCVRCQQRTSIVGIGEIPDLLQKVMVI